jgi:integrase
VARLKPACPLPSGDAPNRRWLGPGDLARLYNAARGTERALVVLEGYNALRRIEARRLRVHDVDLRAGRLRVQG